MAAGVRRKDPAANKPFGFDWTTWLTKRGFVAGDIVSATWAVPAGLVNEHEDLTGAIAQVWLSGGTLGQKYDVVCTLTMPPPSAGKAAVVDQRTLTVVIKDE